MFGILHLNTILSWLIGAYVPCPGAARGWRAPPENQEEWLLY